jgi:hypothetical protein
MKNPLFSHGRGAMLWMKKSHYMSPLAPHLLTRKNFIKSEWRPLWRGAMLWKMKILKNIKKWGASIALSHIFGWEGEHLLLCPTVLAWESKFGDHKIQFFNIFGLKNPLFLHFFYMSPLGLHLLTRKIIKKSEWRPLWPGAMLWKTGMSLHVALGAPFIDSENYKKILKTSPWAGGYV